MWRIQALSELKEPKPGSHAQVYTSTSGETRIWGSGNHDLHLRPTPTTTSSSLGDRGVHIRPGRCELLVATTTAALPRGSSLPHIRRRSQREAGIQDCLAPEPFLSTWTKLLASKWRQLKPKYKHEAHVQIAPELQFGVGGTKPRDAFHH